jgi:hypothetical protein
MKNLFFVTIVLFSIYPLKGQQDTLFAPLDSSGPVQSKPSFFVSIDGNALQAHLSFLQNPGVQQSSFSPLNTLAIQANISPKIRPYILFGRGHYKFIGPAFPEGKGAVFYRLGFGFDFPFFSIKKPSTRQDFLQLKARLGYSLDNLIVANDSPPNHRVGLVNYAFVFSKKIEDRFSLGYVLQINQQLSGDYLTYLQQGLSLTIRLPY